MATTHVMAWDIEEYLHGLELSNRYTVCGAGIYGIWKESSSLSQITS